MAGSEIFGSEEIKAATDVIERKMIHRYGSHDIRGGIYRAEEFEAAAREISGAKYALALSSGTAALITALKGIGTEPGDEIITSPFTFIATVEAIVACGAIPILGDLDETLSLDPASAERLISPRTRAIMPVHMFGAATDMDKFTALGKKYSLPIIEDACEVVGGTYKGRALGGIGDVGAWSFDPNKTLTVGEAGMLFTNDRDIWFKMDCYHDHGHIHSKEHDRGAEGKFGFGVNYRISEIQGALGTVALKKLPQALAALRAAKKKIVEAGEAAGLTPRPMHDAEGDTASHVIFILPSAEAAKKFQKAAKEAGSGCGIISENTWHYAKHWKALEEMGGKEYFGGRTPSYAPETMTQAEGLLSRAVLFGLNIKMSGDEMEKMTAAIQSGAKAAL
ncbi:MAG: DegT/DnrJ/EryC1/StrS family aminotransferase [Synergistaceae bacterium]|nr:DegT/DnrJ/EryC1/StrS family aminotransferase [Synergistaceae bacterium]